MPDQPREGPAASESGLSLWVWSLLGLFAACVPGALLVVEKSGSALSPAPLVLVILAALAGYLVAVRVVIRDRFGQRPRRARLLVWAVAAGLFLGSVAVLFAFRPPPPPLTRMSGARDVAVVGFAGHDGRPDKRVLADVAADFTHAMAGRIPTAGAVRDYTGEVSLPLTQLEEAHRDALEHETSRFADESDAEIVVSGLVATDPAGQTTLRPAVYVRADQVPDAPELASWFLGAPILMARGWESAQGRAQLRTELTRQIGTLAQFMDALDTWRNGRPARAVQILNGLLDPTRRSGTDSLVPLDLLRLFHGHAAEAQAVGEPADGRQKLLQQARTDYLTIDDGSAAGRRAALSLQYNAYLRARNGAQGCEPGNVNGRELADISRALRALAQDRRLGELGRLRATVNLAQAEQCRITAHLAKDNGAVQRAVAPALKAPDITGSTDIRALAAAIAAVNANDRGDVTSAIRYIRLAIANGQDLQQRAVWHGLLATWSLARCDLRTGRTATQDALAQLAAAERAGRTSPQLHHQLEQAFTTQLSGAERRCGAVGQETR
ncbi:hypothetical protein SAMN05428944_0890 [Streptomyces sp. 1222.5]|nr:hypothetical protein BX260_7203 [Streptomyces sp. 5112.2]SEB67901.1 hypothetical protein SAMN05428944_0890 [Streptomyces sp. 1222.5]